MNLPFPVAAFELSAAAVPESATVDFSALFFLLLLVPAVPVLADSLAPSPEAAVVSDFLLFLLLFDSVVLLLAGSLEVSPDAVLASDCLLFLLLLFAELLSAVSELAEPSDADESDFFDFELFFDEVESEFVLLVVLSELAFFLDFLLLVEVIPWSAGVPDCVSWGWARAIGTDNMNNRHIPPARAVKFREKKLLIDMKPTLGSAKVAAGQTKSER